MIINWACRILMIVILGQTLFFKFTGAPESQFIFSTLGVEPWGRYASGIIELIAVIFLFFPRLFLFGALLTLGTMSAAVLSHLTILGIEIQGEWQNQVIENDGGLLFGLAITATVCALWIIFSYRKRLSFFT